MFELNAKRLRLIALDAGDIRLSLDDPERLERNLGLQPGHAEVAGEVRDALQQMLDGVLRDPDHYLWYTHWIVVLNQPNTIAGGLCFKGPPGASGEVEVGYGMNAEYQNRGLMTEALEAMCRWALGQQGVMAVLAETEKHNLASERVLEKIGFVLFRETEAMRWWRLEQIVGPASACSPSQGQA